MPSTSKAKKAFGFKGSVKDGRVSKPKKKTASSSAAGASLPGAALDQKASERPTAADPNDENDVDVDESADRAATSTDQDDAHAPTTQPQPDRPQRIKTKAELAHEAHRAKLVRWSFSNSHPSSKAQTDPSQDAQRRAVNPKVKTHREKISEFNAALARLPEHNDMYVCLFLSWL